MEEQMDLRILPRASRRQAEAIVTWASNENPYEFGIELLRPTDIWGVRF